MNKIAIVGEAWGAEEARRREPFVGPSGYCLTKMLEEAGIVRSECLLTNVFNLQPGPKNDLLTLCDSKKVTASDLPPLKAGKYLRPEYLPELERVQRELLDYKPNLIIALGGTASWFLLHNSAITKLRGTVVESVVIRGQKVLPTFHPAAVLRQWELRHVTVLDLIKAKKESEFPEIRRPQRRIYIEPTLTDLEWFYDNFIRAAKFISFDIETSGDQITCIGFAPSNAVALVVPFVDNRRTGGSYWSDNNSERLALEFVRRVLQSDIPKLAQNALYDIHFLWRRYGIIVNNFVHDTMLLHHALQPESQKGLGFLGSVYTNEASWKLMRSRAKETIKRDE